LLYVILQFPEYRPDGLKLREPLNKLKPRRFQGIFGTFPV